MIEQFDIEINVLKEQLDIIVAEYCIRKLF